MTFFFPFFSFSKNKIGTIMRFALLAVLLTFLFISTQGWSPTGNYAPGYLTCEYPNYVRPADSINKEEKAWVNERRTKANIELNKFIEKNVYTVSILIHHHC